MADKGIIFSAPMVRALLDGTKTQTRRLYKARFGMGEPVNLKDHGIGDYSGRTNDPASWGFPCAEDGGDMPLSSWPETSGYAPADRLYVREAWRVSSAQNDLAGSNLPGGLTVEYPADGSGYLDGRYRHARFMPRQFSRLTLTVTDVRVQRLREISEADAIAEGVEMVARRNYRDGYAVLWNSLHTEPGETWEANPWIVAVSFDVGKHNIDAKEGGE